MKKLFAIQPRQLLLCLAILFPGIASADLWITNFSTASGALASGVWRNITTPASPIDLTIPVTLTHVGAIFDEETRIDDSFPWLDYDPGFGLPVFAIWSPTYEGDYISLEVDGGATVAVSIEFNAAIVDPVLNFTDVDVQTTLVFSTADPIKVIGTANLVVSGSTATTSGVDVLLFDKESAGSLQFIGTFTKLDFQIINVVPGGGNPNDYKDRTGFSVSTTTAPVAAGPKDMLSSWSTATHFHLSWPSLTSFTSLEYATTLNPTVWMPLPGGVNPALVTSWSATFASLGGMVFVRGVY
jgi:hypothetical protein